MKVRLVLLLVVFLFISFAASAYAAPVRDNDRDLIPDKWEKSHGLNSSKDDSRRDPDKDKLNNLKEYQRRTDPHDSDTDDDSLKDGLEVLRYKTSPRKRDSDQDGTEDADEDSDDDGILNFDDTRNDNRSSSSSSSRTSSSRSSSNSSSSGSTSSGSSSSQGSSSSDDD